MYTTVSFTAAKSIGKEYLKNKLTWTRNIAVDMKRFIRKFLFDSMAASDRTTYFSSSTRVG